MREVFCRCQIASSEVFFLMLSLSRNQAIVSVGTPQLDCDLLRAGQRFFDLEERLQARLGILRGEGPFASIVEARRWVASLSSCASDLLERVFTDAEAVSLGEEVEAMDKAFLSMGSIALIRVHLSAADPHRQGVWTARCWGRDPLDKDTTNAMAVLAVHQLAGFSSRWRDTLLPPPPSVAEA